MRLIGCDAWARCGLRRRGYTLVEIVTVVLILSILACIAGPRLNLGAASGARADAFVQQIATALRRTRAEAVLHAGENPAGYVLTMTGDVPYFGYRIVSLDDSTAIADCDIPDALGCSGGRRFAFGPLGNLLNGSDTELRLAAEGRVYFIQVEPATGAVKWTRRND